MCTSRHYWEILSHTPFQVLRHGQDICYRYGPLPGHLIAFQTDMPTKGPAQHWGAGNCHSKESQKPPKESLSRGACWDSAWDGGREAGNTRLCSWGSGGGAQPGRVGERAAQCLWGHMRGPKRERHEGITMGGFLRGKGQRRSLEDKGFGGWRKAAFWGRPGEKSL